MASLVDTNVLVFRYDPRFPRSRFDAHIWAYAERFGLTELLSEDFENGRLYGTVQAVNPFSSAA